MEQIQSHDASPPFPLADHNSDLERQSFAALNACLPMDQFLVRDLRGQEDYGVDAQIELREGRHVTNRIAQVQLKATDRLERNQDGTVSLQVASSNLNYLISNAHAACNLYILYLAATKELRFVWADDERSRIELSSPDWMCQKTVTLRFGTRLLSDLSVIDEIYNRINSNNAYIRSQSIDSIGNESITIAPPHLQHSEANGDEKCIEGDPNRLVDVGRRIGAVRKDLGLDLPQFARALSYPDQRALARIDAGKDQAPMWLIRRVADLSGVRTNWIELGAAALLPNRGRRYQVRSISLYCASEDLATILAQKPIHIYLCLEPLSKQVIVCVEKTRNRWLIYDLCELDFWNWQGSRYQIPKVRAFLEDIMDVQATQVNYSSCYLSPIAKLRILSGDVHPKHIVQTAVQRARYKENGRGMYWTEDFVDIYGERDRVPDTEADYAREYGEWFVVARELMRKWDGAVHPFERMREAHAVKETINIPAGDINDVETQPLSKTTKRFSVQHFATADYGGPINLLPKCKKSRPWWHLM